MSLAFDLISDLHVESWDQFDWQYQATSPFCVVAGDVARDPEVLRETLIHLGQCYRSVFYVDGNDEHRWFYDELGKNYRDLKQSISTIKNVVYLQDNVVVINGVAVIGTNGWWSWDFDPTFSRCDTQSWFLDYVKCSPVVPDIVTSFAQSDVDYLRGAVAKLQKHPDVKKIVIVTHTVPDERFVSHDLELVGHCRYNCLGNSLMKSIIDVDTQKKINTWCFGHYHGSDIDQVVDGIRYVNNYRGRGDTPWKKTPYFPKRIEVKI